MIILTIHSNELRIYSTLKMFCLHVENGKTAASDFKCGARKLATAECIICKIFIKFQTLYKNKENFEKKSVDFMHY